MEENVKRGVANNWLRDRFTLFMFVPYSFAAPRGAPVDSGALYAHNIIHSADTQSAGALHKGAFIGAMSHASAAAQSCTTGASNGQRGVQAN